MSGSKSVFLFWMESWHFKSSLLVLRQFVAAESPLIKIMGNGYFSLQALFVLKIFKFLSWRFGHVKKTAWLKRSG